MRAVIMSSADDRRQRSSGTSQVLDPSPSQLCEDVEAETSDGRTSEASEVCVKKEETLEVDIYSHGDGFNNAPEVLSVKVEDPENKDCLYCDVCKSFFFNKCEVHGPPLFIPDTPVPMGVTDRARQTLPPRLEIQKSGIPHAGLGVFNNGEIIPVGAHFGPYQGELVDREEAMNSGYSWVICRSRQHEEYIDAKREMYANWMRYVNCARNEEEQNLVAFQYQEGILYRCCQPINPGQELMVWYEEEYAKELSPAFDCLWNKKCSTNEPNTTLLQVFSCSTCPLSYASQIYLDKHIQRCHYRVYVGLDESGEIKHEIHIPSKGSSSQPSSSSSLSSDTSHNEMEIEIQHCSETRKSFTHKNALRPRQRIHTGEKPHQCSQCGKSFTHHSALQIHQRIHTGEKPFHCGQCGKSFTHQGNLQIHQVIHTGEKPYHCSQCAKTFAHQSALQQHQRIHTGEKPHQCAQCGKRFTQHGNLQTHQRIHTGEKPYRCSQCGKTFTHRGNLQRHQHIHTGEKPYPCLHCGRSFTRQSALQRHRRSHAGKKQDQCSQYEKSFNRQITVQGHQSIRTSGKPFHCSQCAKSFTHHSSLQRHQHIHTGEKPYHCSQCGKSFTQQSSLQQHQRIHTGEKPFHCSQCGKRFTQQSHLQAHQRIHTGEKPFLCAQCGKSFTHQSAFRKHQRIHTGQKLYQCSQCGNGSHEQDHLQTHQHSHAGEKADHCSQCGNTFTYSVKFKDQVH